MSKLMKYAFLIFLILDLTTVIKAGENDGIAQVDQLEVEVWANKGDGATYYYGEDVAIYFQTNDDCYVVVYDIDPSGNVSMLFPSDENGNCLVRGGEVNRIPGAYDSYDLEISGPSGSEYIYAVATYNPITAPDFIQYENFEYGSWDYYYDDFIHSVRGERAAFVADLNDRITGGSYVSSSTMFYIDENYRNQKVYRYADYDPYYVGSVWVGASYPGCEVWIDGIYYGIAPILVPSIYIGRHWVWIYYGGYPYWQDYVYIHHGQRYYVDAKIEQRKISHDKIRESGRSWELKHEKFQNDDGFKHEADTYRAKHASSRSAAPSQVIEKYSRSDNPVLKNYTPSKEQNYDTKTGKINKSNGDSKSSNIDKTTRVRDDNSGLKIKRTNSNENSNIDKSDTQKESNDTGEKTQSIKKSNEEPAKDNATGKKTDEQSKDKGKESTVSAPKTTQQPQTVKSNPTPSQPTKSSQQAKGDSSGSKDEGKKDKR